MEVFERSKVSYWETRTINIGDYEKVECGLSISHSIIEPSSGYGNKTIQLREGASTSIDKANVQDINSVSNHLIKVVQAKLNAVEKIVRTQMAGWEGIGFDTEKKLLTREIIKQEDYKGAHKSKFTLSDEDLE